MGEPVPASVRDTTAIVEWQRATGMRKTRLFNALFTSKAGLIRQLTQKAARAEKTSEDFEDLYQAGAIGFQKAIERFDAGRGYAISTYAAWWIRHEVQRVARQSQRIGLPRIRLTNEERQRVLVALKENPNVGPDDVGVRPAQFEQVKASFGIRYVSDALPKGAVAVERKLLDESGPFDGEEKLDEGRRHRALERIVLLVRCGHSAKGLGLSPEAYNLALEVIRAEEEAMSEQAETTGHAEMNGAAPAATPKRRPGRPKGSKSATSRKAASKRGVSDLRDKLAKRILEAEKAKIVAKLAKLDDETVAQILSSFAA